MNLDKEIMTNEFYDKEIWNVNFFRRQILMIEH